MIPNQVRIKASYTLKKILLIYLCFVQTILLIIEDQAIKLKCCTVVSLALPYPYL